MDKLKQAVSDILDMLPGYYRQEDGTFSCEVYADYRDEMESRTAIAILQSEDPMVYGGAAVFGDAQVYGRASVHGDARVHDSAMVFSSAMIYGGAKVSGDAQVCGDAVVFGNARVSGNACVSGSAHVLDNAYVSGNALVSGDTWVSGHTRVSDDVIKDVPVFEEVPGGAPVSQNVPGGVWRRRAMGLLAVSVLLIPTAAYLNFLRTRPRSKKPIMNAVQKYLMEHARGDHKKGEQHP